MLFYILQKLNLFMRRHFRCNHKWKYLKYHNLPNEPYMSKCKKCGLMITTWDMGNED